MLISRRNEEFLEIISEMFWTRYRTGIRQFCDMFRHGIDVKCDKLARVIDMKMFWRFSKCFFVDVSVIQAKVTCFGWPPNSLHWIYQNCFFFITFSYSHPPTTFLFFSHSNRRLFMHWNATQIILIKTMPVFEMNKSHLEWNTDAMSPHKHSMQLPGKLANFFVNCGEFEVIRLRIDRVRVKWLEYSNWILTSRWIPLGIALLRLSLSTIKVPWCLHSEMRKKPYISFR